MAGGHGGGIERAAVAALLVAAAAAAAAAAAGGAMQPAHAQSGHTEIYLDPIPPRASAGEEIAIYGWLADGDGYAVPGATIHVKDDVDFGVDDTMGVLSTDEDGVFSTAWTAAPRPGGGAWDIYAVFEGAGDLRGSRSATYSVAVLPVPQEAAPPRSTEIYLDAIPSRATTGEEIVLYGWLADGEGYAVPGATIHVKDDVDFGPDGTIAVLTTDEDGVFSTVWTASPRPGGGAWDIYVVFEGAGGLRGSRSETYSVAVAALQEAAPPALYATQLEMDPVPASVREGQAVAFSGRLSSGGQPVEGARVEVREDDPLWPDEVLASALTGADGRFSAAWTAGQGAIETALEVYAEYGGGSYAPSRTQSQEIEVISSPAPTSIVLDAPPGSAYAGDAIVFTGRLSSGGQPVEGALVEIKEDDPLSPDQLLGSGRTGPDGRFGVLWTASAGLVETDFDIYAEFDGDGVYGGSQSQRREMAVLKYGGGIRLDPLPPSAAAGDMVVFSGALELEMHGTEGARVYVMDEDPLNPDDLLAAAYVEADGRFAANWFASRVDADGEADVYAVFEGGDRFYRQTTCDEGPTFDFGGACTGTVPLFVQAGREDGGPGEAEDGGGDPRAEGAAYMDMHYSMDLDGPPRVAIVPSPVDPAGSMPYVVPVQEGIMMWTLAMENRYGGEWGAAFEVAGPGEPFYKERPDVVVNLASHEDDAGCMDEYLGWARVHRDPPRTVQTTVCTTSAGSPVQAADAAETAAHEFIHAMGLGHAFNRGGDLMCSVEDGRRTCPWAFSKAGVPSDLNAGAVAAMYGSDGFASPNNEVPYGSRYYEGHEVGTGGPQRDAAPDKDSGGGTGGGRAEGSAGGAQGGGADAPNAPAPPAGSAGSAGGVDAGGGAGTPIAPAPPAGSAGSPGGVGPDGGAGTGAERQGGGGGCLIATAAYGTELAPQVQALREYRDATLLATGSGSAFMSSFSAAYYSFSPQVADLEREHPAVRSAAAALIAPLLHALQVAALADPASELSVAAHGAAAVLLAAGLYAGAPAAGTIAAAGAARRMRRRRGRRRNRDKAFSRSARAHIYASMA